MAAVAPLDWPVFSNGQRQHATEETEPSIRILQVNLGSVTAEMWKRRPELRERSGREWTKAHYQIHRKDRTQKFIKKAIWALDRLMSACRYEEVHRERPQRGQDVHFGIAGN